MTAMVESPVWPPQSSHQALLSSPNGRRKFREMQDRRQIKSPSKAQQLLDEGLEDENDEEDEDEETLQLKLAAIEARLKLKKLQNKTKSGASGSDAEAGSSSRPLTRFRSERNQDEGVQVPLSPVKNPKPTLEPVSPRRVILGIDKGVKGRDVSLRRPPASRPESRVTGTLRRGPEATPAARRDEYRSSSSLGLPEGSQRPKSFSERIAESRSSDKSKRERAEELQRKRSTAFNLDKDEMAHFQATAAAAESKNHPSSEAQDRRHVEQFSRDDILRAQTPSTLRRNKTTSNLRGQSTDLRKPPDLQHSFDSSGDRQRETGPEDTGLKPPDATKYEPFSSLHLSNRVLPHSFLTRTLASKTTMRIPDLLKEVKGPSFDPPEVDGDYVVFGIVASKSSPKEHKNQKNVTAKEKDTNDDGSNNTSKYMAITLTDLQWTIDLFLFTTAFTRYYKLSPGTVIAILNPSIMPPPRGKEDTNRFSLTISSSDDTILEIGSSRDLGFCKTVRKDGKVCEAWIDARKTEFCDFHVDVQVRKTKSRRMEISGAGAELFGPGGRSGSRMGNFGGGGAKRNNNNKQGGFRDDGLLKHEGGATYDRATGSTYYVAPAAPSSYATGSNFARGRSAASLLDSDDPFIAEGALSRYEGSKQERMRKRLAEQERERNIARNLTGAGGSNTGGGVGAEYLRAGHGDPSSLSSGNTHPDQAGTSETTAANILDLGKGVRKAGSIKLGPRKRAHDGKEATVSKKTRFMTPKGIREAGRESLGGVPQRPVEEDDDDELDIV